MLRKINSNYILKYLFEYIEDDNYQLKLFIHSELFQEKMEINLYDYKEQNFISKYYKILKGMIIFYIMMKNDMNIILKILIKIY